MQAARVAHESESIGKAYMLAFSIWRKRSFPKKSRPSNEHDLLHNFLYTLAMVMPLNTVQHAALVIREGGVVLHPTDTCYGFTCDMKNEAAVRKLYDLKKMSLAKPSSVMVANLDVARKFGDFSDLAFQLAARFLPGPLTLLVPRLTSVPGFFNPGAEKIGIRIPGHSWTLDVLAMFPDTALITTSANVSGQLEQYHVQGVLDQLGDARPDFMVDSGEIPRQKPSTIIEVVGEKGDRLKMIREGELAAVIRRDFSDFFLS